MKRKQRVSTQDLMRLDDIAKHLKLKSRYGDSSFTNDVVAACVARVSPIVRKLLPCSGEDISSGLGDSLCVRFEEVYGPQDIKRLHDSYVKGKREIGFAQLNRELEQPGVDALLFQRMYADEDDPDRWVAVLNLQDGESRAYWNRFHELSHRIAEPPQQVLPFHRHKSDPANVVESLIDAVAAELAFYAPVFQPLVLRYGKNSRLSFSVIDSIRTTYAPTASLLSTINAVVKYWPRAAVAVTADFRGRLNAPNVHQALRLSMQSFNDSAPGSHLTFFPNMRVPFDSPIYQAFSTGLDKFGDERLDSWSTSSGARLKPVDVFTSARRVNRRVYAVVSA